MRQLLKYIDPTLGVPLPEKNYAENCEITPENIWVGQSQIFVTFALIVTSVGSNGHFCFGTYSGLVRKVFAAEGLLDLLDLFAVV
jgi:hypothetical protein